MAEEQSMPEADRAELEKLVADAPCNPDDARMLLMLEIAHAIGRRTGYGEAVETAKKYMSASEGDGDG